MTPLRSTRRHAPGRRTGAAGLAALDRAILHDIADRIAPPPESTGGAAVLGRS